MDCSIQDAAGEHGLFDETPLWLVNDKAALEQVAARLANASAIGVDTESDSFHHYQEKVCLLQFSDLECDYVVDPLSIGDMSALAPVLANPNIVKIFHGADYDIVCLKRDYKFEIKNVFDTMISSQQLGGSGVGLADLVLRYFGIELEKKYQRHDWSERPLRHEHVEYARGDTHFLLALREILVRKLDKAGRLQRVLEECRILERREWEGRVFDENGWMRVKLGGVVLDDQGKRVLRRVWLYRDEMARRLDRPPFKTIPDHVLIGLATKKPRDERELDQLLGPSAMRRRHGSAFLDAVKHGLADDFPIPTATARRQTAGPKPRVPARISDKIFEGLKEWRNKKIDANPDLQPVAVVSNGTLKSIARMRPVDLAELAKVEDVREWQVEAYGAEMMAVLDEVAPLGMIDEESDEDRPKRRRRRRS